MAHLKFSEPFDVTTGILDKTRRVGFTVSDPSSDRDADRVIVHVAVEQPQQGFVAGVIVAPTLTRPTAVQAGICSLLGVSSDVSISGVASIDVPNNLWKSFYNNLVFLGADLEAL